MNPAIIVGAFAAVCVLAIVLLIRWSLGKSKRLKAAQVADWTPLAERHGGRLETREGRWNHHVLKVPFGQVEVTATISHMVGADKGIASQIRTNNEFRTQAHAPTVRRNHPTYIVSGVREGKGKLEAGSEALRSRFRVRKDSGFAAVVTPEVETLMLALHPHFVTGAQLVSGGKVVSFLFASNTTDPDATEQAMKLVGALAAQPS